MEPAYYYKATTEEVTDGDTYRLRVDLGFRVAVTISGRIRGANSPERGTKEGKAAKAYAESILLPSSGPTPLVIQSYKDEQSFARWIVNVWLPGDVSLAGQLIKAGHAVVLNIP